jgi:hypothetical protein
MKVDKKFIVNNSGIIESLQIKSKFYLEKYINEIVKLMK